MDEFEIIRRYFTRDSSRTDVRIGIGDDGAVLVPAAGRELVAVVDTLVYGVHYPETLGAADVGYRAAIVNLSDIAAMAARPRWMTLALTLARADPGWLGDFAQGLFEAGERYETALVGGDTTRGSETVVSVHIIGDVEPGKALTRAGAKPGESIYVTGSVGDAAAGLSILQSGLPQSDDVEYLVRRFTRPEARIETGEAIAPFASAAIDLSDGLYSDLSKLLTASGVAGSLEVSGLPLSPSLVQLMDEDDALGFALGGGDDYELCFTASDADIRIREVAERTGVAITRIGRVAKGSGLSCVRNGEAYDYEDPGYRHFQ